MKRKKRNKKGFTLVEVIVVLVILAILAAILVPSMVGWINKANDKAAVAEARNILQATQALASEASTDPDSYISGDTCVIDPMRTAFDPIRREIMDLAELPDQIDNLGTITLEDWKVDNFTYQTNKAIITYHATDGTNYKKGFTVESKK